ncbi:MAG: HD domain-containing protein [Bacteroidales bacterium]|nr:HD domain-containing protein [Bacteroidales bacterium]
MIDYLSIIAKFYSPGDPDYDLLVKHSTQVALLTRQLCARYAASRGEVDADFAFEAAMLHDVGIFRTYAPGIYCCGKEPYIKHGIIGREILEELGLERHALVCERHTGSGISATDIVEQHLALPVRDMLPLSIEEKVVCYADKFYSKSRITRCKPIDKVRLSLSKFGEGTIERFDALARLFGEPDYAALDHDLQPQR